MQYPSSPSWRARTVFLQCLCILSAVFTADKNMNCQGPHKGQVNHSVAALLSSLTREKKNPQRCSVSYNKKIHLYFSFFTHLRCHTRVDVTVCWPPLLSEFLLCMCVYFCVPWGQRSSSRCSDRSTVCGVLQHQQPDRGQTVDLWC